MVSAAIATVFAQDSAKEAHEQWRVVADQLRGKFARIASLMDTAEHEVLAYIEVPVKFRLPVGRSYAALDC